MYIHPAKIKPVMFIQQDSTAGTAEGHIYYRYHGENRLIAPAELQHILEERLRNLSETILSKLTCSPSSYQLEVESLVS